MPRLLLHVGVAAAVVIVAAAISSGGAAVNAQAAASRFDGRWMIPADPWFDRLALAAGQDRDAGGGRGGRGDQAPSRDVVLELKVAPSGTVSGRASGTSGRRGAPGSHPAHDVEITRGILKGDLLAFEIWQFDGFHNRLQVTARVANGGLELEFRRDTPAGPDSFPTRARRATY